MKTSQENPQEKLQSFTATEEIIPERSYMFCGQVVGNSLHGRIGLCHEYMTTKLREAYHSANKGSHSYWQEDLGFDSRLAQKLTKQRITLENEMARWGTNVYGHPPISEVPSPVSSSESFVSGKGPGNLLFLLTKGFLGKGGKSRQFSRFSDNSIQFQTEL